MSGADDPADAPAAACPAGAYCVASSTAPEPCPASKYCPAGSGVPVACPAGSYCPAGSGACANPATPVAQLSGNDNGCGAARQELAYRANPSTRPKGQSDPNYRHPRSFRLSEMPKQCQAIGTAR